MTGDRYPWRTTRPLLPVLLTLLFLSGCSTWDNLSAYFNTYYNAARVYEEAEAEVWALPELKSAGGDPLAPFTVPGGAKTKFTSVIEKCSKLLQYHPESGLVDNCLMMIGMSYFYQADYQRAQRKFLELIEGYPDGDYAMTARLMLARTAFKMNDRGRARDLSTQLLALAEEEGEDEIAAHAAGILGRMAYEDGQYEAARTYFERMADGAGNADLRSSAYLRVATIDSVLGDYEAAYEAYSRAERSAANVGAEYKGAIGAARMQSLLGEYDNSLERLDDMGSNSSFRDSYGEIALEVGHVLRRSGDLEGAMQQYRYVDTAFVRTEASGAAVWALGQIYERDLRDLDSARAMYNRARIALPATSILAQPVVRRADAFNKWAALKTDIARYDSILVRMDSVEAAKKEAPPDTLAASDTSAAESDSLKAGPRPVAAPPGMPRDSVAARLAGSMTELATLNFLTIEDLDAAGFWYGRVLEQFPDSRSAPRAMFALAELKARDSVAGAGAADSIRTLLIERYPESEFAAVARRILGLPAVESRSDTSGRMYAQAEALYLSGRYEEAVAGFREVADRFPASDDAARAQYAMGFIYENHLGLNDSAEVHYRAVVKSYPRTPMATLLQPRLMVVDQDRKEMEAARRRDSVAAAKSRDSLAAALRAQDSLAALKGAPADTLKAAGGAAALRAAEKGKDSTKVPPTQTPTTGTPPDTTSPPPGDESEPPKERPEPEPPPGNPTETPPENPPGNPPGEPPPGEEPPPPEIIAHGYTPGMIRPGYTPGTIGQGYMPGIILHGYR